MSEVLFYHLQRQPLERVLPLLLEKSLERGWRCVVRCASRERVEAIDGLLWTYADDSFLPHGPDGTALSARHPVLITDSNAPAANGATVAFLVDSLDLPVDMPALQRLIVLFDGADPDAVAHARTLWKQANAQGHQCTYWQQSEAGRWEKRA